MSRRVESEGGGGGRWLPRLRAPERVRRDALVAAERKAAQGCASCAEAYLTLAEQHGATAAEVNATRRRLFKRAGALAGVGLAASLVDIGGLAGGVLAAAAPSSGGWLGGWLASQLDGVDAVQASSAYRAAAAELARRGARLEDRGALTFLPASRHPIGRDAYSVFQSFTHGGHTGLLQVHLDRGGAAQAVARGDGLVLGWQADRLVHESAPASLGPLILPANRLRPLPGARVEQSPLPLSAPTAHADTCTAICAAIGNIGCFTFCGVLCGPTTVGAIICNVVCTTLCAVAVGEFVCSNVCI